MLPRYNNNVEKRTEDELEDKLEDRLEDNPYFFRYLPAITSLIHSTLCTERKIW